MKTHDQNDYRLKRPAEVESPALLVYPNRITYNIDRLLLAVDNDPVRLMPHIKTAKMAGVVELLIARGIYQFKCATLAEAEMLAESGANLVLVAFSA